jgi:DNA polymerase III epsilon subunit-like protein
VASFAFFDLETTGLRPDRGARITEAAVVGRGEALLDWQRDAEDASSLAALLPRLLGRLEGRVVVGHHLSFDFRFIAYEARRHGLSLPRLQFIDTLGLARAALDAAHDGQLEALLRRFDLVPEGPLHTALVDARAARALFWRLVDEGDLQTLADAGAKPLAWTAP